jgi:hypothetical protein
MLTDKLLVQVPKCRQRDSKRIEGGMEWDGRTAGEDAKLQPAKTIPWVFRIGVARY